MNNNNMQQLLKDWCETEEYIRIRASKVLEDLDVYGDSYGVPPLEEVVDRLVDKIIEYESLAGGVIPVAKALILCEKACREFVRKVEAWEARSIKSYKQMKDALTELDKARKA